MPENNSETFESFKIKGEDLLKEVKKLIREGNIRKILIKDEKGKDTIIEIPVTIGVIGAIIAPVLAAVGALAAMVGLVTVEVIRKDGVSANRSKGASSKSSSVKKSSVRKK